MSKVIKIASVVAMVMLFVGAAGIGAEEGETTLKGKVKATKAADALKAVELTVADGTKYAVELDEKGKALGTECDGAEAEVTGKVGADKKLKVSSFKKAAAGQE